jgi:hypothetical protein
MCVFALFGLLMASLVDGTLPIRHDVLCIEDSLFQLFSPINDEMISNTKLRHGFTIICSLCMDIMVLSLFSFFVFKGRSWRIFIALVIFYGFRWIV